MNTTILNIREMILAGREDFVKSCIETFSCEKIDENGNKKKS